LLCLCHNLHSFPTRRSSDLSSQDTMPTYAGQVLSSNVFLVLTIKCCADEPESGSRKEVFQPHLPVRLPCYDLAPITGFTLTRSRSEEHTSELQSRENLVCRL